MPHSIATILFICVFLYVAYSAVRKVHRTASFFKNSKIGSLATASGPRGLRLQTPLGAINLENFEGSDPEIATIPKYPGAMPVDVNPGYQMQLDVVGRKGKFIEETYWTADPFEVVVGYYRREFPQWEEDHQFMTGEPGGFRCNQQQPNCIRTVEVRSDSGMRYTLRRFPNARTIVKYSVLYGDNLPKLP